MVIIGLTGGMGSGKSFVSAMLSLRGIPVYDSDSNAKRIMSTDADVISKLTSIVGSDLYSGGCLDKAVMAKYIFGSKTHSGEISSVVHPKVRQDFKDWVSNVKGAGICAIESAILFESGFDSEVDVTVAVYAPEELRIKRCMMRDGTDRDRVLARIRSQADQETICSMCSFVIINDGSVNLSGQLDKLIDRCNDIEKNKSRKC